MWGYFFFTMTRISNQANSTIAAIATPPGVGGIAVVRVSGPQAVLLTAQIYYSNTSLEQAQSHRAYLGKIMISTANGPGTQKKEVLDEVLVTVFKAPRSFTGEDVVEISCHGGVYLTHRILDLLISRGARLAEPGEFTQRAFLNGKLDLSQVEAVADLIAAKTEYGLRAAASQFQGKLSKKISWLRAKLIEICCNLELELDFSEEDIVLTSRDKIAKQLDEAEGAISELLATYHRGRVIREGARLAIIGKPNVGKSSLMNTLLKQDRAIVTDFPGTTRDVIEEQLDIRGVLFRVIDTAGIRSTENIIEKTGVARSVEQLRLADVVVAVFDASRVLDREDDQIISIVRKERELTSRSIVAVLNKTDLACVVNSQKLRKKIATEAVVKISATEHLGIKMFEGELLKAAIGTESRQWDDSMVTNIRQRNALSRALASLRDARSSLIGGLSGEFIAVDLRESIDAIGEIIGEVTTEDILDNIFSKFCIGK